MKKLYEESFVKKVLMFLYRNISTFFNTTPFILNSTCKFPIKRFNILLCALSFGWKSARLTEYTFQREFWQGVQNCARSALDRCFTKAQSKYDRSVTTV